MKNSKKLAYVTGFNTIKQLEDFLNRMQRLGCKWASGCELSDSKFLFNEKDTDVKNLEITLTSLVLFGDKEADSSLSEREGSVEYNFKDLLNQKKLSKVITKLDEDTLFDLVATEEDKKDFKERINSEKEYNDSEKKLEESLKKLNQELEKAIKKEKEKKSKFSFSKLIENIAIFGAFFLTFRGILYINYELVQSNVLFDIILIPIFGTIVYFITKNQ